MDEMPPLLSNWELHFLLIDFFIKIESVIPSKA